MDKTSAELASRRVGLITLPIGIGLVIAPSLAARLLGGGEQSAALRIIGACDLALVPGLLNGRQRSRWMLARVALNLAIAGYCQRLARRNGATGAKAGAAAMVVASVTDARTIRALRR